MEVIEIIEQAVKRQRELSYVYDRIKQLNYDIESAEINFINTKYVEFAIEEFLQNFQKQLGVLTVKSVREWVENHRCLDELYCFRKIKGIQAIQFCHCENLFTKKNEMELLSRMLDFCKVLFDNHMTTLQQDCKEFLQNLEAFLMKLYKRSPDSLRLSSKDVRDRDLVDWLNFVYEEGLGEHIPNIPRLIKGLESAKETETFKDFRNHLIKIHEKKLTFTSKEIDKRKVIEVKGAFANVKQILSILSAEQVTDGQNIIVEDGFRTRGTKEIRIIVKLLVINSDLEFPGMNLVVLADTIYVSNEGSCVFDVSGNDGYNKWTGKAKDGKYEGNVQPIHTSLY